MNLGKGYRYTIPCIAVASLQVVSALISLLAIAVLASFVVGFTNHYEYTVRMANVPRQGKFEPSEIDGFQFYLRYLLEASRNDKGGNASKVTGLVIFSVAFPAAKVLFWIVIILYFVYSFFECLLGCVILLKLIKPKSHTNLLPWVAIWSSTNTFSLLLTIFCSGSILLFTNLDVTMNGVYALVLLRLMSVLLGYLFLKELKSESKENKGQIGQQNELNDGNSVITLEAGVAVI